MRLIHKLKHNKYFRLFNDTVFVAKHIQIPLISLFLYEATWFSRQQNAKKVFVPFYLWWFQLQKQSIFEFILFSCTGFEECNLMFIKIVIFTKSKQHSWIKANLMNNFSFEIYLKCFFTFEFCRLAYALHSLTIRTFLVNWSVIGVFSNRAVPVKDCTIFLPIYQYATTIGIRTCDCKFLVVSICCEWLQERASGHTANWR